jgi:hypothetical protein
MPYFHNMGTDKLNAFAFFIDWMGRQHS